MGARSKAGKWANDFSPERPQHSRQPIPRLPCALGRTRAIEGGINGGRYERGAEAWVRGHADDSATQHEQVIPPLPRRREPNFVGRIVARTVSGIVGRSNPSTCKRMRFLVAQRACVGMTSRGGVRGPADDSATQHEQVISPLPRRREPNFVGRIVGQIVGRTVGRSSPSNHKRMRFLVARRALSE